MFGCFGCKKKSKVKIKKNHEKNKFTTTSSNPPDQIIATINPPYQSIATINPPDSIPDELNIITWNINRLNKRKQKVLNEMKKLMYNTTEITIDVVFLQETRSLEMPREILQNWHAYYTQYSATKKGVAILVNKEQYPSFTPYSQEVDSNGRYVVVQGKLGEDYTLVSVYNHKDDITTLDLLTPYLQTMTVGTLVIGGDFNTTFDNNDRAKKTSSSKELQHYGQNERNPQHEKIKPCVEELMENLQLVDVFREKNVNGLFNEEIFTFVQTKEETMKTQSTGSGTTASNSEETPMEITQNVTRLSRLDYFFMPEERMCSVTNCQVLHDVKNNDHRPLLLQLDLKPLEEERKIQTPHTWETQSGKYINAVEIVAAIQSVQLGNIERPGGEVPNHKNFNPETIDKLKCYYNKTMKIKAQKNNLKKTIPLLCKLINENKEEATENLQLKSRLESLNSTLGDLEDFSHGVECFSHTLDNFTSSLEGLNSTLEHFKDYNFTQENLENLNRRLNDFNSALENCEVNQYCFFNVKCEILTTILAWRLKDRGPPGKTKRKQTQTMKQQQHSSDGDDSDSDNSSGEEYEPNSEEYNSDDSRCDLSMNEE